MLWVRSFDRARLRLLAEAGRACLFSRDGPGSIVQLRGQRTMCWPKRQCARVVHSFWVDGNIVKHNPVRDSFHIFPLCVCVCASYFSGFLFYCFFPHVFGNVFFFLLSVFFSHPHPTATHSTNKHTRARVRVCVYACVCVCVRACVRARSSHFFRAWIVRTLQCVCVSLYRLQLESHVCTNKVIKEQYKHNDTIALSILLVMWLPFAHAAVYVFVVPLCHTDPTIYTCAFCHSQHIALLVL